MECAENSQSDDPSYVLQEHGKAASVSGPIDELHVDGHNNHLMIQGFIEKLYIEGHNNRIEPRSPDAHIRYAEVNGHNNKLLHLQVEAIQVNGHNNKIVVNSCEECDVRGFNNDVRKNGVPYPPPQQTMHHSGHRGIRVNGSTIQINTSGMPQVSVGGGNGISISFGGVNLEAFLNGILTSIPSEISYGEGEPSYVESQPDEGDQVEEEGVIQGEEDEEESKIVLTQEQVQQLIDACPIDKFGESGRTTSQDVCSICMEKFKKGNQMRRLPCAHCFHPKCVDPWLSGNLICPNCRNPIYESSPNDQ